MKKFSVLLASVFLLSACYISTAKISNPMACAINYFVDGECTEDQTGFARDTEEIFVTIDLDNAPEEGTEMTFDWKYVDEDQAIDSITFSPGVNSGIAFSNLPMPSFDGGWPTGTYSVTISLNTDNSEPIVKKFTVVENAP